MQTNLRQLMEQYCKRCSPALRDSESVKTFVVKLLDKLPEENYQGDYGPRVSVAMDEIIGANRGDKGKLVAFVTGFCKFVEREAQVVLEPRVFSAEVIDDPTERRLKMARFLHQPRSVDELVSHFFQSDRTIRKDLAAMEEGISFMGQRIQIRKTREGGKIRYQSTLHPVFLPLNLTEVYALTAGLLAIIPRGSPLYDIYQYLAEFIYGQLSDYGRDIIFNAAERERVCLPAPDAAISGSYRDERDLIEKRAWALAYMLKRFEICSVHYVEGGEEKVVCGRIRFNPIAGSSSLKVIRDESDITLDASQIIRISPLQYN